MRRKSVLLLLIMVLTAANPACPAQAQNAAIASDFQYALDGGGKATIVNYTGSETGTLIIPEQLDGHPVTAIGQAAFLGNSFSTIVIPAGLTSITPGVFGNCKNLVSIDVEAGNAVYEQADGVLYDKMQKALHTYPIARDASEYQILQGTTIIGNGAFFHCDRLMSVVLPDSVASIGESAFYGCESLQSISIPSGVTAIGNGAFSLCASLRDIIIPGSVKSIGASAFDGCLSLDSLTVAEDNPVFEVTGGVLFDKTQKLLHTYPQSLPSESYQVPEGTLHIGSLAFASCPNLISVTIPDSVSDIGESAFYGCAKLESVSLPRGITRLEASVFAACLELKSITIPDGVRSIGSQAFYNCAELKQVNIPYGVTAIEPYAFAWCGNLREITIPGSILVIGDHAFMACDFMSSLIISSGVQEIGTYTFGECYALMSVSLPASVVSIGENAFYDCYKMTALVAENSYAHEYCYKNKLSFAFSAP